MKDVICDIIIIVLILFMVHQLYQLIRNQMVFKIRAKWIESDDWVRWNKFTYDFMMRPSKQNWFGIKLPKDKDFKLKKLN